MIGTQKTERSAKVIKKISLRAACLLVVLAIFFSGVLASVISWNAGVKTTEEKAAAEKQEYMERYNTSRSSTYKRLTDSWTKTLADVYGDVIFYGDSITAGGIWEEYYPYLSTVNLGVVGDTVDCLITRLPQIEMLMCEKCFVMIGVNDLINGLMVEELLVKYEQLLKNLAHLREEIGTEIYVQSVLPVREDTTPYSVSNEEIRQLNEGIAMLAERYGMTWIDIHSLMADEEGELDVKYSYDGLHLTELAYYEWQEALIPYVDE